MITGNIANSLAKPLFTLLMSILRLFLIFIPLALLFSHYFALNGIFMAMALANFIVGIIALNFIRNFFKEISD